MATFLPPVTRWLISAKSDEPAPLIAADTGRLCSQRWTIAALVVVAGMALFYRLGTFRTFGSHEVFAVVPAREMIDSGDWVFPKFGGLPRLRKPPLVYWVVAASAKTFGELNPLTARLPFALAGLLLASLMGLWAKRWYGSRIGWAAVFVQLTSIWFVTFARKAEIDIILCLFTTGALFLIADQPAEESRQRSFWRWLGIYALLSLSWLAKFHYGPAMILAPAVVYFLLEKRRGIFTRFLHPVGLAVLIAALAVWPMLILERAPDTWEIWRRETLGRALGEMGSHSVLFYVPYLLWLPMPWTFFAIASVRNSWKAANAGDSRERFLWVWFLIQFGILTVSANKHKHYLLALLPVVTLFAARSLSNVLHGFRSGRLRITRHWIGPLLAMNAGLALCLCWIVKDRWPELSEAACVLGATVAICQGAGWVLLYQRRVLAVLTVNVISLVIVGVVIGGWIVPNCDRRANIRAFAMEIRENALASERVCVYCMDRNPLVYHLGPPVDRAESLAALRTKLRADSSMYVIGYERIVNDLRFFADIEPLARLPRGKGEMEPIEGDLVLVKLTPPTAPTAAISAN